MDGAASLRDLVHDVLDLIGQGLVLTSDLLKLENSLLVSRLDLEQFRGSISGLLLAHIKIKGKTINLALHFTNGLVELLGLPLHGSVDHLSLVKVGGHLGDLGLDLALGLSIWANLALRLSIAASASVFLAESFILVISSSSALATASVSYFCLIAAASPSALALSLRMLSRPAASYQEPPWRGQVHA